MQEFVENEAQPNKKGKEDERLNNKEERLNNKEEKSTTAHGEKSTEKEIIEDGVDEDVEDDDLVTELPSLDPYKVISPEGKTFLHAHLEVAKDHTSPIEYHIFNALIALGLAVGRRVSLYDDDLVWANIAVCLLGASTIRKTKSLRVIVNEYIEQLGTEEDKDKVEFISGAGSAQFLIEKFAKEENVDELIETTENGKQTRIIRTKLVRHPVTGLAYFNELSVFSAKANNLNSDFKGRMMEFIDGDKIVSNGTRTRGESIAYKPFASFLTTTQPKDLRNVLNKSDIDKGLVNRFLFPTGNKKEIKSFINKELLNWERPAKKLKEIHEWAKALGDFSIEEWDKDAVKAIEKFRVDVLEPTIQRDKDGTRGRLELHVKKFILLFAINDMSTKITLSHVESAIALFYYMVDCYNVVSGNVVSSELSDVMSKILKRVEFLEQKEAECIKDGKDTTNAKCSKRNINARGVKLPEDVWADAIGRLLKPGGGLYRNTDKGRKDGRGGSRTETFNTYKLLMS